MYRHFCSIPLEGQRDHSDYKRLPHKPMTEAQGLLLDRNCILQSLVQNTVNIILNEFNAYWADVLKA
jgi:hypothetical protein